MFPAPPHPPPVLFPPLPFPPQEALEDFRRGEYEWALLGYLKAVEMGMELGQSNAAWMLAEGYGYEGGYSHFLIFDMVASRDKGSRGVSWQGWMQVVLSVIL